MRYKGDHKCRRAADMGLTLLPLNLTVLHITRTFLSTSWGAIEVCIVEIHGLFSSDDDSREEQQRCASSWGWPEECRVRDPVQPAR